MPNRDFYNVLGVSRDANPDELKRAYRNLAMRWHPDRNQNDPVAEGRFKDVNEAYRVLSDPELRARYDRLGPLFNESGRPPSPDDMSEVVGRMWSNLWGKASGQDGENLKYTLSIRLEEVSTGITKQIRVPRQVGCRPCAGTGALPDDRETCEACHGSGRSRGSRLFRTTCYHCQGRGFTTKRACPTCHGEGRVGQEDTINVKVPPGIATGQKLKLTGKGNEPVGTGATGDLFVVINVADHPIFRRRGEDLLVDLPLTFDEAVLGADITVPTLRGTTVIRIPPATPHGKVFRLAGRGLPKRARGGGRGDLHLIADIQVPEALTQAEKARLSAWAASLAPERHPRRQAFKRAIEER